MCTCNECETTFEQNDNNTQFEWGTNNHCTTCPKCGNLEWHFPYNGSDEESFSGDSD